MIRHLRKMSPRGDDAIAEWDTETVTPERLEEIEREFRSLTKQGYFAADITEGRSKIVKEFNPNADLLMLPRVQGG